MAKIERNPRILQFPRKFSIDIFADKNEIVQNELVTFGAYYPNLVEFYWDFGDGTTSNQRTPTKAFTGPVGSSFTVSLVAVADDGFPYYAKEVAFVTITGEGYLGDVIQKPLMLAGLDKMVRNANRCIRIREDNNDNETDIGFDGDIVDINAAKQFRDNNNANNIYWVGLYNQIDDTLMIEETDKSKQELFRVDRPTLIMGRFDNFRYPFNPTIDFNPIDDDIYAAVIFYGDRVVFQGNRRTNYFYGTANQNSVFDGLRTLNTECDIVARYNNNNESRRTRVMFPGYFNQGWKNLFHTAELISPIKYNETYCNYNNYTSPGDFLFDSLTFTHMSGGARYSTTELRNAVIARDVLNSEVFNSFYKNNINDVTLNTGSIDKPYL